MSVTPFAINPRPIYQKSPPVEDSAYLRFIREQPCAVQNCKARFVEAAHTGARGLSTRANDRDAIPLCPRHHQHGELAYHRIGRRRFESRFRLCIADLIQELNEWYEIERQVVG